MSLPSYRPDGFGARSRAAIAVPDRQSGMSMRVTATFPSRIGNSTAARQGTSTRISMRTTTRSCKAAYQLVLQRPSAILPVSDRSMTEPETISLAFDMAVTDSSRLPQAQWLGCSTLKYAPWGSFMTAKVPWAISVAGTACSPPSSTQRRNVSAVSVTCR